MRRAIVAVGEGVVFAAAMAVLAAWLAVLA